MPDNSFWHKRNNPYHNVGPATVADTIDNTFEPRYIPQQKPLGISPYSTNPVYSPRQVIDDQSYGTSLSDTTTTKLKIEELRRLVNKYPQYCPDGLLQWIIISCDNGDNQLLEEKLAQLRTIERRLNGWY